MKNNPNPVSPQEWVRQMFSAKSAIDGGIVRRKVTDVDRLIGRERFLDEVRRRGFRVVENAGQFIILCNRESVRLLE